MEKRKKDEILGRISKVLQEFSEIEIGYVFGSFLKGDFRDIDIGLLLKGSFSSSYEATKFAMKVGRKLEREFNFSYEFDIRVLNFSPTNFQYRVIKEGKPIFSQTPVERIRYESELLSKYLDYKETSDWFDKKLILTK